MADFNQTKPGEKLTNISDKFREQMLGEKYLSCIGFRWI